MPVTASQSPMLPGVSGQVQDLQTAVAEIDDVAVDEQAGCGSGGSFDDRRRHPGCRHGIEEELGDVVAGVAVGTDDGVGVDVSRWPDRERRCPASAWWMARPVNSWMPPM